MDRVGEIVGGRHSSLSGLNPRSTTPLLGKSESLSYSTMSVTNDRVALMSPDGVLTASVSESGQLSFSRSMRKPFHYPVDRQFIGHPVYGDQDLGASATYNRHRYYSRLTGTNAENPDVLRIPDHVLPYHFIIPQFPFKKSGADDGKQGSILTIFAIWNMLMGSTLLCLPWALHKAGLVCGLVIMLTMLYVCFYTANLIIKIPKIANIKCIEFSDACYQVLGRWAQVICVSSSLISLVGTCIVYWVLMTNFLFHIVSYAYELVGSNATISIRFSGIEDVVCDPSIIANKSDLPSNGSFGYFADSLLPQSLFDKLWDVNQTAPFALALLLVPIVFVKSPTIFMKFNAFGTLSVVYLLGFVVMKAGKWNFVNNTELIPAFQWTFPIQTGVLSQSLFVHNCLLSVLRLQRNPENNSRDLGIAYFLVGLTYFAIACFIYVAFPLAKDCLSDNFLDNFESDDILAFGARIFMFFQVLCLYPLFACMLRSQTLHILFPRNPTANFRRLFVFNLFLISACIVVAVYIPKIGTIIRFCGSFSGLVLIFALPPIAHLKALRMNATSGNNAVRSLWVFKGIPLWRLVFHAAIVVGGVLNCVAQFLVE